MIVSKRNYALDFWKFVFSVIVVLFHSANMTGDRAQQIFVNGRIAVEFFFIVSGCMMAASLERSSEPSVTKDTVRFIKRKYISLMPHAVIGSLLCFAVMQAAQPDIPFKTRIVQFIQALPETFLFKSCGLNIINFNGVTWYLSSMLLVMAILYPLYKRWREIFPAVVAPLAFLFLMGYLYKTYGSLSNLESWVTYTSLTNVRALADILGGIVCWQLVKALQKFRFTLPARIALSAFAWLCFAFCLYYIYKHRPGKADFGLFALFMVAVTITVSQCGIEPMLFRSKIFAWLGKYSLSLYVGHSCWRKAVVTDAFYPAQWNFRQRVLAYLLLSVLSGLFIMYFSELLRKLWAKLKDPLKNLIFEKAE